jgi:hypothetical protein
MGPPIDRSTDKSGHSPPVELAIDCANCGTQFSTTLYEAKAFCSRHCHDTARVVRYGRKLVVRFGPTKAWPEQVLLGAVDRVPEGVLLADMNRRWEAATPDRPCDDAGWNDTFQAWVAANRREAQALPAAPPPAR